MSHSSSQNAWLRPPVRQTGWRKWGCHIDQHAGNSFDDVSDKLMIWRGRLDGGRSQSVERRRAGKAGLAQPAFEISEDDGAMSTPPSAAQPESDQPEDQNAPRLM